MQGVAQLKKGRYSQASLRVQPKGQIETPITRLTRVCVEKSRIALSNRSSSSFIYYILLIITICLNSVRKNIDTFCVCVSPYVDSFCVHVSSH